MEYHVEIRGETIIIRFSISDNDVVGDGYRELHPGESFYHLKYEDLFATGEGAFHLDEKQIVRPKKIPECPPS
jgi:hypothetical protein